MMVGNDSFSDTLKKGRVRLKTKTKECSYKELKEQNINKSDRSMEESNNATWRTKFHYSVLLSGSSENETGIPCNKVNTRSMTKIQNAASKDNNDASGGGNDRGNRNKRSRNEYLKTNNENRKQTSKEVVIKNQGVKKLKTSMEQIASDTNKKGKTVKRKTSDKSNFSESNHEAIVKRNDKPIVKNEVNTRSMTKKQNAASKDNNDASGGGNDRGNRNKPKTTIEQIASVANKKGKTVKSKTSDKNNFSKSNHEAIVKRYDKPIVKNEVNTRSMTKRQNAASKDNDTSGGGNDRGNRNKRSRNEYLETNNENRKQTSKEVVIKSQGVKKPKTSMEQIASVSNKKGKTVKRKTSDKSNFSESNHEAIVKRNDKPIVKNEANHAGTLESRKNYKEEKKNSGKKIMISSSGSRGSNENQAKKRKSKINGDILSASSSRENEEARKRRKKQSSANKEMDENNYFNKLPVEIILHIFQYLSIKDLVNVKSSYTYLKKVTENRDAWKGKVWRLASNNREDDIYVEQLKNIRHVQMIEIISATWDDNEDVMKSVLHYVEDIQLLTVTNLSFDLISRVIQKYSNLEFLSLEVQLQDSLYVLESLSSNCQRLRELNFVLVSNIHNSRTLNESYAPQNYHPSLTVECCKKICKLLEDSFPELISINLKYFQLVLKNEDVAAILEKRKHKLQDLGLCWYDSHNNDLIKIISKSAMNVDLTIFCDKGKEFDIILLKDIKSVDIRFFCITLSQLRFRDRFELSCDFSSFSLPNVKTLELLGPLATTYSDFVSVIVNMFPKLKLLKLYPIHNENVNDQLSHLKYLPDLTVLSIWLDYEFPLSKQGISHISQCLNLKRLKINFDERNDDGGILSMISNLLNLTHLELYGWECEEQVLLSLVRSLPNLNHLMLIDYINTCKPYQCCKRTKEIPLVAAECDERNICLMLLRFLYY